MSSIKMVFTGDSFIAEALPKDDLSLTELTHYLAKHDVRMTNLEVVLHNFEQSPSPTSGGTWAVARPERLDDLTSLSFNLFSCANNHNLDWLHGGVVSTVEALEDRHLAFAGIGRTLSHAAQIAYLPTPKGRVAMISVTSSFQKWHRAGDTRFDVQGRAGVNPLGHKKVNYVTADQMQVLKAIDHSTTINASRNLDIKEGFIAGDNSTFSLGNELHFQIGDKTETKEEIDKKDWQRIAKSIAEAKRQADYVVVSFHSHEFRFSNKDEPADFIQEFCHRCIDNGADILVGHGPHILRGVEVYKNRPIFYSLGNFIFQNDLVEKQPRDFYDIYQLDESASLAQAMDVRSDYGKRGLSIDQRVWESVVASLVITEHQIAIEFQPIDLGFELPRSQKGRPKLCYGKQANHILGLLQQKSSPFGVKIEMIDGKGYLKIAKK